MVKCKVCEQEFKSLFAHIRLKHDLSGKEYLTKFPGSDMGYSWGKDIEKTRKDIVAGDDVVSGLNANERGFYQQRYSTLWENSNEDPVLAATISQVVINEIFIRRYQLLVQKMAKLERPDQKSIGEVHKTIDTLQSQNLKTLDSLNLTKAKRDLLNKSPESTPSRMVTSLALVCANMTPTEAAKNEKDIAEAMGRLREHVDELLQVTTTEDPGVKLETVELDG